MQNVSLSLLERFIRGWENNQIYKIKQITEKKTRHLFITLALWISLSHPPSPSVGVQYTKCCAITTTMRRHKPAGAPRALSQVSSLPQVVFLAGFLVAAVESALSNQVVTMLRGNMMEFPQQLLLLFIRGCHLAHEDDDSTVLLTPRLCC